VQLHPDFTSDFTNILCLKDRTRMFHQRQSHQGKIEDITVLGGIGRLPKISPPQGASQLKGRSPPRSQAARAQGRLASALKFMEWSGWLAARLRPVDRYAGDSSHPHSSHPQFSLFLDKAALEKPPASHEHDRRSKLTRTDAHRVSLLRGGFTRNRLELEEFTVRPRLRHSPALELAPNHHQPGQGAERARHAPPTAAVNPLHRLTER